MTALSVNVNKIAVLRNARGGDVPDVVRAARACLSRLRDPVEFDALAERGTQCPFDVRAQRCRRGMDEDHPLRLATRMTSIHLGCTSWLGWIAFPCDQAQPVGVAPLCPCFAATRNALPELGPSHEQLDGVTEQQQCFVGVSQP